MDSKALRRKADEKLAKYQEAVGLAASEGRELSEDETRLKTDAERLEAQARELEAVETQRAAYSRGVDDEPRVDAGNIQLGRDRFEDDPKRGFRNPREFLMAVLNHARGGRLTEQLKSLAAGSDEQGGYSDPYGGFLVPAGFSPELLSTMAESDPISARVRQIPMNAPTVAFNASVDKDHSSSVSGGLRVYRRAETDTVPASRMQFEQVRLEAHSLFGVAFATEEILQDSAISFISLLESGFGKEFAAKLVDERLNGSGVGQFLGVLKSPCLITVAKEGGQPADSFVYMNLVKMRAQCFGYGNAIWLANHDTLPQLLTLVNPAGQLIWQQSARDGEPDRILGRPIIFTEFCDTVGDAGDIVLGDWSQYLEGTYQRPGSAESIHVRFENHERAFKFYMRNDGAPWWRSALTPKNGAAQRSPFVTLAARA
ncbi:MAG TPA: phage major capsid protein [Candidatus Sumerlaeota bacterium]|nr:phage major capsid protein [Candidatus Sumerlaeota bacterium]